MQKSSRKYTKYLLTSTALSMLVIGATSGMALAQQAGEDVQEVVVVGVRASQQSAIDRKKKAKTATDSIVAEDVGSFPDRNINEALSRVAGVGITRGETGEGEGITLRGNTADLTRVELDGMSTAPSGADLALNQPGGRAADLRELPADLIKSVDVVKGATADQTEGGLGGTVSIQTRTGLDFKKPYFQMRLGNERNSLNEKWAPDIGIVASRKFFNGRLGITGNLSYRKVLNESHQTSMDNFDQGYYRLADFDNSPEKTVQFNPATVGGSLANVPIGSYDLVSGSGKFNTNTPLQTVTLAANAKTKSECEAAFPLYTESQLAVISTAVNSGVNRRDAQNVRIGELLTCLNQWNDYTPGQVRDAIERQYEDRLSWDIRLDYRVNDKLTTFVKYQQSNRKMNQWRSNRSQGNIDIDVDSNGSGLSWRNAFTLVNNTTFPFNSRDQIIAGDGYYLYNPNQVTAWRGLDNTAGAVTTNNGFPVMGQAINVVPGSVTLDGKHHVTSLTLGRGEYLIDHILNTQTFDTSYLQTGANYKDGPLQIDFMASRTKSGHTRYDLRSSVRAYLYGAKMSATSDGSWKIDLPSNFDPNDISQYMPLLPATGTTASQVAQYSDVVGLGWRPRITAGQEDQAKLDLTYRMDDFPILKRFKAGVQYRAIDTQVWRGAGFIPKAGVSVPTSDYQSNLRACENQPTTTALNACVYGYVPNAMTATSTTWMHGVHTMPRADLLSLISQSVWDNNGAPFFPGYEGLESTQWNSLDLAKLISLTPAAANYNFACVKVCKGSDGNLYNKPTDFSAETVTAAYYMFDFEQKLPFDMSFEGNFGVRAVFSTVQGSGFVSLNSTRKNVNTGNVNTDWNETNGYNRVTTTTINKPVAVSRSYADWLPSYNAALWAVPDKVVIRYNWAKTVSRPAVTYLFPAGACTVDERTEAPADQGISDVDQNCTTFGNPDLKPYTATKNNTAIEWYVNKDTYVSLAYYRQKVKIGKPLRLLLTDQRVFEGTDEVDPVTGRPLSDFQFTYSTYINQPGETQSGWEFSTKSAFTFLPWRLRYTGVDFNYSTNKSKGAAGFTDLITGTSLGSQGRPDYFANLAVWYDDGKTSARLAYQKRSNVLECMSNCGVDRRPSYAWPSTNPLSFAALPYNPGEAYYNQAYGYLDAKVSHKVNSNVEFFLEARNLTKQASVRVGTARGLEATPESAWNVQYAGRRFNVGIVYKMQ
ncbi:TonB-dependent receptor [Asticcacaulis sp. DW145]|uniref:TonB-dependent receptor n=1 Tax=Asticcacaulis sp. DW145 TaxID=3095608 RepID=UPI00308F6B6B|nr:TonB-dependent receptor [Asticcacaulis sp. DW145]